MIEIQQKISNGVNQNLERERERERERRMLLSVKKQIRHPTLALLPNWCGGLIFNVENPMQFFVADFFRILEKFSVNKVGAQKLEILHWFLGFLLGGGWAPKISTPLPNTEYKFYSICQYKSYPSSPF